LDAEEDRMFRIKRDGQDFLGAGKCGHTHTFHYLQGREEDRMFRIKRDEQEFEMQAGIADW
jgi:hypothetical protein